jgi:hypothetical protein
MCDASGRFSRVAWPLARSRGRLYGLVEAP